jgi:hypothetical protein
MAIALWKQKRSAVRISVAIAALTALSACMEDGGSLFQPAPGTQTSSAGSTSTRLVERDVEAPEIFQKTEAGLWDGRPSLGGVWVAHPDVKEPERALIRNSSNSKFVIGALFRPSVERPGPRFQVSSDAAEALGMIAGQPVNLNVTALRREEVPNAAPAAAAEPAEDTQVASLPASEAVETQTLDPVAGAAAALDRAEAGADATAGAAAGTAATVAAATPEPAEEPRKKRRFFWQKKDPEPEQTMADAAPVESPAPATAPQSAASPAVETAAISSPPPARPTSSLDRPYLQIGIFSVEQNARNTAVAMRQSGIIPTVLKQSSQGKTFWRVIVGPATTTEERAQLLTKVKAAGFTDAYAVTN